MIRKLIVIIIAAWILFTLFHSCSNEPKMKDGHLVKVEAHSYAKSLYYSGTVQPLKSLVVTSPADGVIVDMPFQYGEPIKKGQLLFVLSSAKFLTDYKSALMTYIKAKNDFNTSETQMKEAEFLHKNELISLDEYKTKQSNFYGAQLGLLQAKDALENLIHQLDMKDINLYNLSIADIDKITQAMHLRSSSENLRVLAPADGMVLAVGKNEDETKRQAKGDAVKQGDALAVIGDLGGISVRIKVNELTVNQLKIGQKVTVTGIAFTEHALKGIISRVDRQGESSNGGLPSFAAEVNVPTLTSEQQKQIHVGMSAKVEILIDEEPQLLIPMTAIQEKDGSSFVKLYDAKTKKIKETMVRTGITTADSAAILSGLKPGDQIVVPS